MANSDRLRRLHDATAEITRSLDLQHRIRTIVRAARELQSADAAALMLHDARADGLRIAAQEGLSETYASRQRIPMERARAAYRGPDEHVLVDLQATPLGDADLIRAEGLARALALPLVHDDKLIGALTIYTKDPVRSFDQDDIEIAHILSAQAAIAIANSRLYEDAVAQRRLNNEILEALGEGVITVWPDGRAELNPRAREILGVDASVNTVEQLREAVRLEASSEEAPTDAHPLDRALRGERVSAEYSFVRSRAGERRDAFITAVPLRGDGQIVAAVATVHDLTGVRAAERDREQFLSIVSHELRTPLTPLKAIAQLIRSRVRRSVAGRSPMDFESLEKNLAAIERQVDRMNGLVSDLVSVSQAQRGALQMEPTSFDLAALVREVVQRYVVSTADDGRYAFRVEAPEALPATGDQARIDQLLMNLIGNAVKYSPSGGQIDLQVKPHVGGVEITIQDKGIGIPREDLLGLGQPFARGTGRAATFAGMGVGLYVARLVAEGHGGGLEIASDGTEKGTTVRVRLVL